MGYFGNYMGREMDNVARHLPPFYGSRNRSFERQWYSLSASDSYEQRMNPYYTPKLPTHPHIPGRRIRSSRLRLSFAVFTTLGILVGLGIGAAVYLSVYFSKDDTAESRSTIKLVIPGEATRTDWTFTDELRDPNSDEYKEMSNNFCSIIATQMAANELQSTYDGCQVTNISAGSVIIKFELTVLRGDEGNSTELYRDIVAAHSEVFAQFSLEDQAKTIIGDDDCLENRCENEAVCLDYLGSYLCVCQGNFWGEFCENSGNETPTQSTVTITSCPVCDVTTASFTCPECPSTSISPPASEVTSCQPCPEYTTAVAITTQPPAADSCQPNPCNGNSSCLNLVTGDYFCACPQGWNGRNCSTQIQGKCASHPCGTNSTCLEDAMNESYYCVCESGYTGRHCREAVTLHCNDSNICQNGGTCRDLYDGGYFCLCQDEFIGQNCSTETTYFCDSKPCQENATCLDDTSINDYHCVCPTGYSGKNCTDPIILPCDNNPCQENATCLYDTSMNDYHCVCPTGYFGKNCTDPIILPCDSNPCQENATCLDDTSINDYYCTCPTGYSGKNCTDPIILPCDNNPCQENATCLDDTSINDYHCVCPAGYSGKNCTDSIILPCDNNPCQSNGTCLDLADGLYRCICADGFTGQNCSSEIPAACDAAPCRAGSTCLDATYQCVCAEGYEGINCTEETVDVCTAESPCENSGTCHTLEDGSYYCQCTYNWTGTNCTQSTDMCSPDPCENDGVCHNLLDEDYLCVCGDTGSGKNCTLESCPNEYTLVGALGCFHLSSNNRGESEIIGYCDGSGQQAVQTPGIPLVGYSIADLQTIAQGLNSGANRFWLGDTNGANCFYFNGVGAIIEEQSFLCPGSQYRVVCKFE